MANVKRPLMKLIGIVEVLAVIEVAEVVGEEVGIDDRDYRNGRGVEVLGQSG